jgi:hypothetical protein
MDMTDEMAKTRKEGAEAIYEPKYAVARVADFLNISKTGVWRLIWTGKLKSYRFSGRTLVGQKHLKEFLDKSESGEAS